MRRSILLLLLASGCTTDGLYLEQQSILETRASSLVLLRDGTAGQGTMNEQMCRVDTATAGVLEDFDLPAGDTRMEDAGGSEFLAVSSEGLHISDQAGWNRDIALPGVLHARVTGDGVTSLVQDEGGCRVDTRNDAGSQTVVLDAGICAGVPELTVDPGTGRAWVAYGAGVVAVTPGTADLPGTATELGLSGDSVAFDAASGVVYVAGPDTLSALDGGGALLWERETPGLREISDMGALGDVVLISEDGPTAQLEVFDGETGETIGGYEIPTVADIVVSADASTLALVAEDGIYFYNVMDGPDRLRMSDAADAIAALAEDEDVPLSGEPASGSD